MTRQPKWLRYLQYSPLAFAVLDVRSEKPDPKNQLVMSSPSNYIIIARGWLLNVIRAKTAISATIQNIRFDFFVNLNCMQVNDYN